VNMLHSPKHRGLAAPAVLLSSTFVACSGSPPSGPDAEEIPILTDQRPLAGPSSSGIWITRDEILRIPAAGPAWEALRDAADADAGEANVSDQDQKHDTSMLAKALVHVRTGDERYRTEVRQGCLDAVDTELGGRTLALGRNLVSYVIAADLVGLDPGEDATFRAWLRRVLNEELAGRTLVSTQEERPNNWGTHAAASRAAVAAYLHDQVELDRTARVFRGWLGDRSSYAGFDYGDLSWQADEDRPVGINRAGAVKDGWSVDGLLPDEMRRGCGFRFPPCETGYCWEALQGATVTAEILSRRGYPAWEWEDRALLRAVEALLDLDASYGGWWAEGDDEWNVWLVNHAYGTSFPTRAGASPGKNMAWTDWTHTS